MAIGLDVDGQALSWHSADGTAWSNPAATFGDGAGSNTVEVTDVIDNGTGWVAVGREDPACQLNCGLDPVRALVWTSKDGSTWRRLEHQRALDGGAITGIAHSRSGFVAVGSAGINAAAWTSADGLAWTRSKDGPVFHAALSADGEAVTLMASVASGDVIAAVGTEFPTGGYKARTARAWWSADGVTWTEATGELFEAGQLFTVTGTTTGFLAGGPSGPPSCGGGVWESDGGRSWTCASPAPQYLGMVPYAAASSPTVEVVVGLDNSFESDEGYPGAVWWRAAQ